jgi:hypothetical protein
VLGHVRIVVDQIPFPGAHHLVGTRQRFSKLCNGSVPSNDCQRMDSRERAAAMSCA